MEKPRQWRPVAAFLHFVMFSVTWVLAWLQHQPLMDGPAAVPFFLLVFADFPFSMVPWGMMWGNHMASALVLWGVGGTAWWYFLAGLISRPKHKAVVGF